MSVGELRASIADVPDDYEVVLDNAEVDDCEISAVRVVAERYAGKALEHHARTEAAARRDTEPDAGNLRYIAKHAYDGERCVWCGINIYDAAEDDPCVDHEPITYTSDATGLREAVEAAANEYAANGAARDAAGKPAWPNNVARDLRAILAAHPDPTREPDAGCVPCGVCGGSQNRGWHKHAEPDAGEDDALEQTLVAYDERGGMFGTSGAGAYFLATHLLASDWLAAHDAEVARTAAKEAGERIARAIENYLAYYADVMTPSERKGVRDAARIAREEGRADVRM
jgi:hypothetical protein